MYSKKIWFYLCFVTSSLFNYATGYSLFGFSSSNERPKLDGRIVGGYTINITDAPHQISLQTFFGHICGGSIIHQEWILTAAHCTSGKSADRLKIRLGSSMFASGGELFQIQQIIQHPLFNYSTIDFDFALLQLKSQITFDATKQAISLPSSAKDTVLDGSLCTVTGWGNTQNKTENRNWLRLAEVPKFNQELCAERYQDYGGVTERMLCAGYEEGGKDACQGDSGGPLVHNNILVGVVSWGYGCAKPEYPGVYSSVAYIRDWIKEQTGV